MFRFLSLLVCLLCVTNVFAQPPNTLWTRTYGGNRGEYGWSVHQKMDGCFVIVGSTYSFGAGSYDFYLLKTGPDILSAVPPNAVPRSLALCAYPNPFNPTTTISFTLPQAQTMKFAVFDVTGREVTILADRPYAAGEHSVTFDGSDLPSGIYFAHLSAGTQQITQKLLLVK